LDILVVSAEVVSLVQVVIASLVFFLLLCGAVLCGVGYPAKINF